MGFCEEKKLTAIYTYIGYILIFWQAPLYEGPSLIANSTATG